MYRVTRLPGAAGLLTELSVTGIMLMYGREAQSKTRIASPATIPKSGERNRKIHSCIRPIVTVSPVNDELLSAVGRLTAEYGKIGGNLNQIARALNEYGTPYNALSVEVRAAISDLAALKFEVLRKVGDAVGNIQTYQL